MELAKAINKPYRVVAVHSAIDCQRKIFSGRQESTEFFNVQQARADARVFRHRFEEALWGMTSADTSVVVLGSLARDEFTCGSDVDWTLLVDSIANPKHLDLAHRVRDVLQSLGAKQPGPEGIFGNMAFSHEIVHQIGGEDDTNSNTTRRILLVLESRPIGSSSKRTVKTALVQPKPASLVR